MEYFKNSKGNKLCGILTSSNKDTVIILCHGFSTSKNSRTYLRLEKLLKNKISVFRFDFYGHGESEGKFEDITISEAVDDVLQASDFMKQKGFKKIGLFGSSFGGLAAILVASQTKDIFVLALKAPVSDFSAMLLAKYNKEGISEWKEKGFSYYESSDGRESKLNYSFFEDAEKHSACKVAENITAPALIVHGDKDTAVPLEQSKKTASLIKNCKLEIIKGADHWFSNPEDFEQVLKHISEFVTNAL